MTTNIQAWPEPELDWVPIRYAYSLLRDRIIASARPDCGFCISDANRPSPFGIVVSDGHSSEITVDRHPNEITVNYNGRDMLLVESNIKIRNSNEKNTFRCPSKWWDLESTIFTAFRERCGGCDIGVIGPLVLQLHSTIINEFRDAPKNRIVRAFGRFGSIKSPLTIIGSDIWEIYRVDFESNGVVLTGGEQLYSVHFAPIDPMPTKELQPVDLSVPPTCSLPSKPMLNEPVYSTGAPGRPSSKSLIETELQNRIESRRMELVLKDEAEALAAWLRESHPSAPPMTVRTIENAIRKMHRNAKPQKEKQ
jgi:hypothetical protein